MTTIQVQLPPKLVPLYSVPRGEAAFRVLRGGRCSGKSFSEAKMAAIWGAIEPLRILCTREYQNSVKQSFHAELKNAIVNDEWLSSVYDVGVDYLRHIENGTEFIFKGLRSNIESIKSMAQIDLVIVEEAESVPEHSWVDLLPTIRAFKSEVHIIYNPKSRDSWVAKTFDSNTPPPRTLIVDINYRDNPWFPPAMEEQRLHNLATMDRALYRHIWEGAYYERSEAQVFAGKYIVEEFTPQGHWDGPYFGLDFGFSQDPTAASKCWVNDNKLYVEYDFSQTRLELDSTPGALMAALPGVERHVIRADNARPESISYLKRHGLPLITACKKGKGSVVDGIEFIKSFDKVVLHPRCGDTLGEMDKYSYKVDRLSGDILPSILDEYNHIIDSIRYALEPIISSSGYTLRYL